MFPYLKLLIRQRIDGHGIRSRIGVQGSPK